MGSALMLWLVVVVERPGATDLRKVGHTHTEMLGVAKSKRSCCVVVAATFMFVNAIKINSDTVTPRHCFVQTPWVKKNNNLKLDVWHDHRSSATLLCLPHV